MSKVLRGFKNVTKGYSTAQVKVRHGILSHSIEKGHILRGTATSNDPWGPSGSEMSEIALMTFNSSKEFYDIMDILEKRLNDEGKNWRHVLKSLRVLDYAMHEGSELVGTWAQKNIHLIKVLREFQYIDRYGSDNSRNGKIP
jgi:epsin